MSETGGPDDPDAAHHVPLPPEAPPSSEPPAEAPAGSADDGGEVEWWRTPPPSEQPPAAPPGPDDPNGPEKGPRWRWDDVKEEWRDTWATHGQDGLAAAHEIAVTIGEAVVAHLPSGPHAAAERHGLDIRWLRLKINIPAILIAVLVTWRGDSFSSHVAHSMATNGPLALLGWAMTFAIVMGLFMLTPVGGPLGEALMGVLRAVTGAVGRLLVRGWSVPYIGYVLRLVVAVVAWSIVIALGRLLGRAVIHVLTGA